MALPDLFGGKKDDASKESEKSESEDAAQDILDAIADKDAKALDMALKRHYELCEGDMKSEDEDDEGEY